jgi:hypothetical protein
VKVQIPDIEAKFRADLATAKRCREPHPVF